MTGRPEPYADGIARWLGEVSNEHVRSVHPRLSGATTATIVPFGADMTLASVSKTLEAMATRALDEMSGLD